MQLFRITSDVDKTFFTVFSTTMLICGGSVYSASKGAVIGMTLPMARDLARYGIRVMTIAPGIIDTPLMQAAAPKVKEGLLAQVAAPKRFGAPEEFAQLVTSIIDNGYLNGEVNPHLIKLHCLPLTTSPTSYTAE